MNMILSWKKDNKQEQKNRWESKQKIKLMNKRPKNMNSCVRETYRKSYNWEHMLGNILLIWYLILLVHIRHMIGRHCVKVVRIRSYSGPYFPRIGLNTDISPYSVRMWENTDQNNSEYAYFLRSEKGYLFLGFKAWFEVILLILNII